MTASIDQYKHNLSGDVDIPGLGENPALESLDRASIRHQLSFADKHCLKTERRAVTLYLDRLQQYYKTIGYLSPLVTKFNSEIGRSYGLWIEQRAYGRDMSGREVTLTTDIYRWSSVAKIFGNVRFACAETALRLAKWEFIQEVPESEELLLRAMWAAHRALSSTELTGVNWRAKRCRWGTVGFRRHLDRTIKASEAAVFTQGIHHGYFLAPSVG